MKRLLTGALGLALACLLAISAAASDAGPNTSAAQDGQSAELDPALSLSVQFDYDDRIRTNVAVPAFIEVTNSGEATDVVARVLVESTPIAAWDLPVRLESGATKVTLPFYALRRSERVEVKLLRDGKTVAADQQKRAPGYVDDRLVGILSGNPEGMTAWQQNLGSMYADAQGAQNLPVTPVALSAADFPAQAALLDRFALIVLNHFDLALLDEVQGAVLADWVKGGGHLLVDADTAGAPALRSLTDIVELRAAGGFSDDEAAEKLSALSGRSYAFEGGLQNLGKVEPAGEVVVQGDGGALISLYEAGQGRVFVTAFALDDPFFQQTRAAELFGELPGLSAIGGAGMPLMNTSAIAGMFDAAGSIDWLDAPALSWIILVLLGFILLAGPVNYLVLKKLDKRDWLWVTTPAMALLFCVLVMGLGMGRRGSQLVSSTVTVVDSRAENGAAQAFSFVGVGAPRQGAYEVKLEAGGIPLPAGRNDYYAGHDSQKPIADPAVMFGLGGYPEADIINIPQWNLDGFVLRRDNPAEGALEARLLYEDGAARYTVTNNTGADLEEVTVLSHLGYCRLLLLENGETLSGELEPFGSNYSFSTGGAYLHASATYNDLMWAFREAAPPQPQNEAEQREAHLRTGLVNAAIGTAPLSTSYSASAQYYLPESAVAWGWSRELGALPLSVNGKTPANALNRTLIVASAPITYEGQAQLARPIASVEGTISDMQNVQDSYYDIGDTSAMFSSGEVTFSFDLPSAVADYTIESLMIFPVYEQGGYEAFLYNNATGDWAPYTVGEALTGSDLGAYLDEDGVVRLKLAAAQDGAESVIFEYPTVSVAGKERA